MELFKYLIKHDGFIKYFKNTSWVFLEKVLRIFVGIFVTVWVARYLGPQQFGILSYAIALVGIFSSISTLGLDSIVVRELVKNEIEHYEIIGTTFFLKLLGAVVVIVILYIITNVLPNDEHTNVLIFIIASSTIFHSFNVIDFYFQSKVLSKYVVYANIISFSICSFIKIFLILNNASLTAFAWVILLESIILAIGLLYFFIKLNPNKIFSSVKFKIKVSKTLLSDSWPLILSGLVISVYMKIDQVMINQLLGNEAVGQYSAAVRLSEAWYFVPVVIAGSLFPAIINARKVSHHLYYSRLQKLFNFMVWVAISIALLVTFFSSTIVDILYGYQYFETARVLTIHIWASVFVFLGVASGKWFVIENYKLLYFFRTFYGMLFNIILNLIFIPRYGIEGAAWATLIGQSIAAYFSDLLNAETRSIFKMKTKTLLIWRFFNAK